MNLGECYWRRHLTFAARASIIFLKAPAPHIRTDRYCKNANRSFLSATGESVWRFSFFWRQGDLAQ